jgi:hypothetical protein
MTLNALQHLGARLEYRHHELLASRQPSADGVEEAWRRVCLLTWAEPATCKSDDLGDAVRPHVAVQIHVAMTRYSAQ